MIIFMKQVFLWIGIVTTITIMTILIIALIEDFSKKIKSMRENRDKINYKKISFIVNVKVPISSKKLYTPIAYFYGRSRGVIFKSTPPIVTIIGLSFFKKLPDETPIFITDKKNIPGDIKTIADVKRYLKNYQQSISSEGWE